MNNGSQLILHDLVRYKELFRITKVAVNYTSYKGESLLNINEIYNWEKNMKCSVNRWNYVMQYQTIIDKKKLIWNAFQIQTCLFWKVDKKTKPNFSLLLDMHIKGWLDRQI